MTYVRVAPDRYTKASFEPSQYPGLEARSSPERRDRSLALTV